MKTPPVSVVLDATDAVTIGLQLQALARFDRWVDDDVPARMRRVGDQLYAAARAAGAVK